MYKYEYPHPAVTTDSIVFTIRDSALHVLLIERAHDPYAGQWAFPGGFIEIDEDLHDAVRRELQEETGLTDIPLEQFHCFGAPGRDPRERVITVAYLALIPDPGGQPAAADDAADARWFPLSALPPLAFDHEDVIRTAYARLLERIEISDIALGMVGDRFTLSDLQQVYEVISGDTLDPEAFRDWVLSRGWIEQTGDFTEPRN